MPPHARGPAAVDPHSPVLAGTDITVRPLVTLDELKACVALQHEVWGKEYDDAVPASLLQVVSHVGGILAGAFTPDGEMVGFVFGLTGIKDGEAMHWSHELGVRSTCRDAGVGRMLKQYQRTELARLGIATIFWTFDPLMAKNAHLNLNRLGARVVEYVENMYGTTKSPLHHGLATDRFIVSWSTASDTDTAPRALLDERVQHPVISAEPRADDVIGEIGDGIGATRVPLVLLEVPADLEGMPPARLAAWQASLRTNFERALSAGYAVTGLHRDAVASRSFYVLELTAVAHP